MKFVAIETFIYDGKQHNKGEVFNIASERDANILSVIGKVAPAKEKSDLPSVGKSDLQTRELESHKENTIVEDDDKNKYSRRDMRARK